MRILAITLILVFIFFVFPHGIYGDGFVRFEEIRIFFEQRNLAPMKYSLVQPLLAAPFYALGYIVKNPWWWCARFNSILLVGLLVYIWKRWKNHCGPRERTYILICIIASMFPKHLGDFYGEVLTVVFLTIGMSEIVLGKQALGWSLALIGCLNSPATLPALFILVLYSAWTNRKIAPLLVPVAAVTLFCVDTYLRLHSFTPGYGEIEKSAASLMPYSNLVGFSYPLFFGILSILFSFGKGLVFFVPGFFLYVIWRKRIALAAELLQIVDYLAIFTITLIFTYAKWWAWHGSWFWGPRFFLVACVPASIFLGIALVHKQRSLWRALLLLAVTTLTFWVAANGIAFDQGNLEACGTPSTGFLCLYVPEFSVLWRPFVINPGWHGKSVAYLIFFFLLYARVSYETWRFCWRRLKRRLAFLFKQSILPISRWHF